MPGHSKSLPDDTGAPPDTALPILGPLTDDQRDMLEILLAAWHERWNWPVFDYVSRMLVTRNGADAFETSSRMPVLQGVGAMVRYQLLFFEHGPVLDNAQKVGLTIAGFWRAGGEREARTLVEVIGYLADEDGHLQPDPDRPVSLDVGLADVIAASRPLRGWSPRALADALSREPALWGNVQTGDDARVRPVGDRLAPYRGVHEVEDYLRIVAATLGHPVAADLPTAYPPLALVEALGYLDAVWRYRLKGPLLGRNQPVSWVRLAQSAASTDEFDARLSALTDVLVHLDVRLPAAEESDALAAKEGSLLRLRRRLRLELDALPSSRVDEAIETLRSIVRIRAGGQHSGLGSETASAFRALRLPYPPLDYAVAWEQIRSRAIDGVNAIRQEIQAGD